MIVKAGQLEYYMDGYLQQNLAYIRERVLQQVEMFVCVVDGRVGSGKSTLACQLAAFCSDGKLGLDDVVFSTEQFREKLRTAKKGSAIVLDEAFALLNKRTTLSSLNMVSLSLMQQARSKQVFIFIVLPSFFDLDKNLTLNISDLLVHCYRKPFGRRGQFVVYERASMRNLWLYCRQSYTYNRKFAKPNFFGRFTKFFPLDFDEYSRKKDAALESRADVQTGSRQLYGERNKPR